MRRINTMTKTLNVAIIGVGGIARTHIPGWEASEYTEVVAGCDINPDILSVWGQAHGITKLVTDPDELFKDPDIDIIDICTPNMYHTPLAVAAMEAGKDVLCEKPLAPTPDDIREMIAARDRSGRMLMTAQHFRFKEIGRASCRERV
jgi:predicted dehydrogenase